MSRYNYLIVGGGCAGLSMAWQLVSTLGAETRILIVDRETKTRDDRSWACWTDGPLPLGLDAIVHHRWSALSFGCATFQRRESLQPYTYSLIRGIDYYNFLQDKLKACTNVHWQLGEVDAVGQTEEIAWAQLGENRFSADYLFDSRPQRMSSSANSHYFLWQHFRGITIRTKSACFDATTATLMDFRAIPAGETAFFYVLPFSPHEALVEYTVFSKQVDKADHYERQLQRYCTQVLGLDEYEIVDTEIGKIPMTDAPLHPGPAGRIHPIGTAAGCVKPTTGYAFLRIHAHNADLVAQLQTGQPLTARKLAPARLAWYDKLLLHLLSHYPARGPEIFSALFRTTNFQTILRFLDEQTSIREEVSIFRGLPIGLFLRAAWSHHWGLVPPTTSPVSEPSVAAVPVSLIKSIGS